jgi:ABC-type Mn2+/Zn2+ transport system permease subunit
VGGVDAELLAQNGWAVGFLIAALQLSVFTLAGFVWLTARAYQRGDTAIGVLFTVLLLLIGGGWVLGVLLGLILGWVRVRRWQAREFMAGWSLLFLLAAGNLALAVLMRKMSREEWREWFGWLPQF